MAKIQIIVGSVMGTAQGVAEFLQRSLAAVHQVRVNTQATLADLLADPDELLLFCTSNTGTGELPDNIVPLYIGLTTEYPRIAGRLFGLINLGDSSYPTFGQGGQMLFDALVDIGATSVMSPLLIDGSVERYPQKLALDWVQDWLKAND